MRTVLLTYNWLNAQIQKFIHDENGDEIFEKAAVIAAVTVAVLVIIAIGVLAANALEQGKSWFG
ncbi:hypothetical protein KQH40_00910 [bacterium]|nr:hypothetical protein [bacterium]